MAQLDKKNPSYSQRDEDFSHRPSAVSSHTAGFYEDDDDLDAKFLAPKERLQMMKEQSMNRQLDSTKRAMASIYESEQIGIATAEELVHQGEQLNNVEEKISGINQNLKTSQQHLTSIKSIFGGIKNWWHGKPDARKPEAGGGHVPADKLQASLDNSLNARPAGAGEHPALKLRSGDARGFYDESDGPKARGHSPLAQKTARQAYEESLESNIEEMSLGMSRLKGLAVGLGDEIETQNKQVERITAAAERADVTLGDQNRQMRHILK